MFKVIFNTIQKKGLEPFGKSNNKVVVQDVHIFQYNESIMNMFYSKFYLQIQGTFFML